VLGYAAHVRLYLTPYLGEVLLAELRPAHDYDRRLTNPVW
jgi:hypothetical protein